MSLEAVAVRMGFTPEQALALEQACFRYGIEDTTERAYFLGQVAHESGTGKWMEEIWGPTAAQRRYEGRADLGNTKAGDGFLFRGRGLIQLTGRDNYIRYSRQTYGDLRAVMFPDMVARLPDAAFAAGWYWRVNSCGMLVGDGIEAVTRCVNGGTNGLSDRRALTQRALALFEEIKQ